MFQEALKKAQQFTLPVIISFRTENGDTNSIMGAFIVLNRDGWILTANHIVEELTKLNRELELYKDYMRKLDQIKSDSNLTTSQRRRRTRSLAKPSRNPVTNCSSWWGRDGWRVDTFSCNSLADLAIGQIIGFDSTGFTLYPEFKNPALNFEVGVNLCKLGFPFHGIKPDFDETANAFSLSANVFPIPLFPIDGIFTRHVVVEDGQACAEFVETSTPGLRGQSGGPIFDGEGRVWALQSHTVHHPLGFSPKTRQGNQEHQFLNCGMGTHARTIVESLEQAGVGYRISED